MFDYTNLLGIPFKEGGMNKDGMDCRGLVLYIQKMRGIEITAPDSSFDPETQDALITQALAERCVKINNPEPFCIVSFWNENPKFTTHLGTVIENGYEFIHILRNGFVSIERLDNLANKNKITGFYRVNPLSPSPLAGEG